MPRETKVQLALLERREMLDLLAQLDLKDFKELVALKENPDPRDCLDLKVLLDPLVLLVKRVAEVFVENLVNLDLLEK